MSESNQAEALARSGEGWVWWESRRLRYNLGLAVAGAAAYACIGIAFMARGVLDEIGFTQFLSSSLIMGTGYLLAMGLANLCYLLGVFSETIVRPVDIEGYRERVWRLGFWVSCALPFAVPVVISAVLLASPGP